MPSNSFNYNMCYNIRIMEEQLQYIKKYHTDTGVRGQKVSPTNRGNKNNSYRETRTDKRAKWFKAAYKCLERRDALIESKEEIKGGSGCQT